MTTTLLSRKYSVLRFNYAGGAKIFEATFALGCLTPNHIQVYALGDRDGLGEQQYLDFTYDQITETVTVSSDIVIPSGADNVTIVVQRTVPKEALYLSFNSGADVTRTNIDGMVRYTLMALHEVLDGRWTDDAYVALLQQVQDIATDVLLDKEDAVISAVSAAEAALVASNAAADATASAILAASLSIPRFASLSDMRAATIPGDAAIVDGALYQQNVTGPVTTGDGKRFAAAWFVTPRMFGAVGDGTADDLLAIRAAWDYAGASKVPCIMEGLEYNCSDAVWTSSNLTVLGGGAVMYVTAWPSLGTFVSNVRPVAEDRIQGNIRIYDLITDGSKLPAPTASQNTNLGPEFARGASNVRIVNCTARKMRDGGGGGTGGGGHGGEQGLQDVHFIGCTAEDCYRGPRIAGVPDVWSPGVPKNATGIVFRDYVARRCGTAFFAHSVGHGGDDQSDLAIFDVLVDGLYIEDCGHYPWREFDFAANPLIAAQKTGIINLGGAQNVRMRGVRVKFNSGYPATFTDWLGRTGYPASGNYIGAGLSGNVGALIWGHGRNCVIEDITLDGAVDAYWKCARAITFGDLGTTDPTVGDGTVQQNFMGIRHVRQTTYNYVFDGFAGIDNADFGAQMEIAVGANPVTGVIGPNGTATLSNLRVRFTSGNGDTEGGDAVQWLAAGNVRPSGAQALHSKGGADFLGGYSSTGTRNGVTISPATNDLRSSRNTAALAYHQRFYNNPAGVVGGVATKGSGTRYYITATIWISGGIGTPEGVEAAPVGCMWLREDGGASTTLYVKQSGTGNTGWVAK